MSDKGNCHDNASAKFFYNLLKNMRVWHRDIGVRKEVRTVIFQDIEFVLNRQILHQTLETRRSVRYQQHTGAA